MDTTEVEFRLLGPVRVRFGDRLLDVGAARKQSVLVVLLLDANRCVLVDQIVERVWGDQRLPDQPRNAVRTYVSLLRTALAGIGGVAVERQAGGYRISIDERLVDVHRFHGLIEQARGAADDDRAAALVEEALGLWRGEPFTGLDTPWINIARESLAVWRQSARLDLIDIRLRHGRHADVLAELTAEAAERPLDERVSGQLMLALYRAGRQADALAQYRRVRQHLADELGSDPGPALCDLQQRILIADPALVVPAPSPAAVPARRVVVPRQLPAAPRLFTGRASELARLSALLDDAPGSGHTLAISAIGGTGGIGKTWLALRWAHQHLDRFPDGQLYVNLRGFDPSGEPLPAEAAVRGFLDALGVDPAAIPSDLDAQVGLYRSLVAGKRVLIVADNARDTAQVVPLLPGTSTCAMLVTSRRRMPGLITAHGAHTVNLDVLPDSEARQLLACHLGADRVAAAPDAVGLVLACCAGLPLALSIVAARAVTQPDQSMSLLAEELRDASLRLDALASGDLTANVRAALSWSYAALHAEAARVLGLLTLSAGPDLSLPAAASLTAQPSGRLRTILRELEEFHLLQQHTPGRYRLHDLVRLYAAECAGRERTLAERDAAMRRVLDFYLHTAHSAARLLDPHRASIQLDSPEPGTHPHPLPDAPTAVAWFEAEHANLLAAQRIATTHAWHLTAWQLAWTLSTFHYRRGYRQHYLAVWQAALEAAEHLPDPATRTYANRQLGLTYADLGRREEATKHFHHALTLAEHHHDLADQALIHRNLMWAWARWGDDRQAKEHATCALDLYRALDQPEREAFALNEVGWLAARLGEYDTARVHCQSALALHRHHQNIAGEADTLDSLGYIEHLTGHPTRAVQLYQQALTRFRSIGNTYTSADTLDRLGQSHTALGQHPLARATWHEALELYQEQQRHTDAERIQQCLATLGPDPCGIPVPLLRSRPVGQQRLTDLRGAQDVRRGRADAGALEVNRDAAVDERGVGVVRHAIRAHALGELQ